MKRTKSVILGVCVAMILSFAGELRAEGAKITSFGKQGTITWSCSSLNVSSRVEWAQSPAGPWQTVQSTWVIFPTNQLQTVAQGGSGFYRVVYDTPDPHLPDITAAQALALFCGCSDQPNFEVLDVRRASEFVTGHIVNAINIDYDNGSATFRSRVNALDKNKVYLLHCSAGGRSDKAHDIMRAQGFHEVYNMLGGFNAFKLLPGATAFIVL